MSRLDDVAGLELTGALPQNVNYALKSSYVLALLESIPEIAESLAAPKREANRSFVDIVKEVEAATVLILAY